jgi:two-component system sensor histidine kinase/response regulator
MDGVETARAIHDLKISKMPSMIMVTAYGREEVFREAGLAGFEQVLLKPVSPSTLFNALMHRLGKKPEGPGRLKEKSAAEEGMAAIKGARILLVEDNELNQQVASELLSQAGLKVEVAADGQQALDMVQKERYDAVLMDMQMPVMDGMTATREIRQKEEFKELPVIAMTANVMQRDIQVCLEAGMNDHIAKPIDPDEMFNKLQKWIKPAVKGEAAQPVEPAPRAGLPEEPEKKPEIGLPEVPGLDTELGLKRVMGNRELYIGLLRKYLENQGDAPAQIRASLLKEDPTTAERLAHTLKSTSGSIGASGLQQMSFDVEKAVKNGVSAEELNRMMQPLGEAHSDLVARLKEFFSAAKPESEAEGEKVQIDKTKAEKACSRLAAMLAEGDSEALDFVKNEKPLMVNLLGADVFRSIEKAAGNYDFEKALALLEEQAGSCRISLKESEQNDR